MTSSQLQTTPLIDWGFSPSTGTLKESLSTVTGSLAWKNRMYCLIWKENEMTHHVIILVSEKSYLNKGCLQTSFVTYTAVNCLCPVKKKNIVNKLLYLHDHREWPGVQAPRNSGPKQTILTNNFLLFSRMSAPWVVLNYNHYIIVLFGRKITKHEWWISLNVY